MEDKQDGYFYQDICDCFNVENVSDFPAPLEDFQNIHFDIFKGIFIIKLLDEEHYVLETLVSFECGNDALV